MSGQSLKDRLELYPFESDGRKPAEFPKNPFPRLHDDRPTVQSVRITIQQFLHRGQTCHSKNGQLVSFVIDFCERNKIPYVLSAVPGQGYVITRANVQALSADS